MNVFSKIKLSALLIGDIINLYAALVITLLIRYGNLFYMQLAENHFEPFTIIFVIWIMIFYIAGLYDLKLLKNTLEFQKNFWYAITFGIIISALFFYAIPSFGITPKTNLLIFFVVFGGINYAWRQFYNFVIGKTGAESKILMVGSNQTTEEIVKHIEHNPQLGYKIGFWLKEGLEDKEFEHLSQILIANNITTIIIPAHLKKDYKSAKLIYKTLLLGIEVLDLATFYEIIFKKIPLSELEEVWFLENLVKRHKIYELIKEPSERLLAFLLLMFLLPIGLIIAGLIKLTSKGPAIFKQTRIGKNETEFTIYKFRTMQHDAEKNGPQWANYFDDKRATPIGRFLRKSHLDEIPQLINIIKGDLSFIGPRPERPEFVASLKKDVPYFELRLLIKPGVSGWAQINFRYGASVQDAYEKVQHDIYYIKNQSLFLDLSIALKTLKFFLTNHS